MKTRDKFSREAPVCAGFDLLRARIEAEISRPAVVAITSSTSGDGIAITSRHLAYSLSVAGYRTLLADANAAGEGTVEGSDSPTFEELARLQSNSGTTSPGILTLTNPNLQRTTGQRSVILAFEALRAKFDYIVIGTDYGAATSFATTIIGAADAVLVSVKKGRREKSSDLRLCAALDHLGARFLGVVSLDVSLFRNQESIAPDRMSAGRRGQPPVLENERQRRGIVL